MSSSSIYDYIANRAKLPSPILENSKEFINQREITARTIQSKKLLDFPDELKFSIRELFLKQLSIRYSKSNPEEKDKYFSVMVGVVNLQTNYPSPKVIPKILEGDTLKCLWMCSVPFLDKTCSDVLEQSNIEMNFDPSAKKPPFSEQIDQITLTLNAWKHSEAIKTSNDYFNDLKLFPTEVKNTRKVNGLLTSQKNLHNVVRQYGGSVTKDAQEYFSTLKMCLKKWDSFFKYFLSSLKRIKLCSPTFRKKYLEELHSWLIQHAPKLKYYIEESKKRENWMAENPTKIFSSKNFECPIPELNNPFKVTGNKDDNTIRQVIWRHGLAVDEEISFGHLVSFVPYLYNIADDILNEAKAIVPPSTLFELSSFNGDWLSPTPLTESKKANHFISSNSSNKNASKTNPKSQKSHPLKQKEVSSEEPIEKPLPIVKASEEMTLSSLQKKRAQDSFQVLSKILPPKAINIKEATVLGSIKQAAESLMHAQVGIECVHSVSIVHLPQTIATLVFDLHCVLEQLITAQHVIIHKVVPDDHYLPRNVEHANLLDQLSAKAQELFEKNPTGTYFLRYPQSSLNEYKQYKENDKPFALKLIQRAKEILPVEIDQFLREVDQLYDETMEVFDQLVNVLSKNTYKIPAGEKINPALAPVKAKNSSYTPLLQTARDRLRKWKGIQKIEKKLLAHEILENAISHLEMLLQLSSLQTNSIALRAKWDRDLLLHFQVAIEQLLRILSLKIKGKQLVVHDFSAAKPLIADNNLFESIMLFSLKAYVQYPQLFNTCNADLSPWIKHLIAVRKLANREIEVLSEGFKSVISDKRYIKNFEDEVYTKGTAIIEALVKLLVNGPN